MQIHQREELSNLISVSYELQKACEFNIEIWSGNRLSNVFVLRESLLTETEKECITNPNGNGYHGTLSTAYSGLKCIGWIDVTNTTITASSSDNDVSQSRNYCRRLAASEWNSVVCVVYGEDGKQQILQPCSVPYCGNVNDINS